MAKSGQTLPKKLAQTLNIPEVLLLMPLAGTPEEQIQLVKSYQRRLDDYVARNGRELAENISREELGAVCSEYITVVEQNAQAAGTHRSLIQRSILTPQNPAEREGRTITVEQSRYGDEGLGGLPIPEVMRLQLVRKNDPLAYMLKSVL